MQPTSISSRERFEYPLEIELDITQDDYIEVEILEQIVNRDWQIKDHRRTFLIQSAVCACVALLFAFLSLQGRIAKESLLLVAVAWIFCLVHFLYSYKIGYNVDFNHAVNQMLQNRETNTFFTPEKGYAYFYEDRCEFLTNEQRRYFDYSLIQNIKIIKHIYIFVMKRSKEKGLKGFAYMVIPKRNLDEKQERFLDRICTRITEQYSLKPWTDSEILD